MTALSDYVNRKVKFGLYAYVRQNRRLYCFSGKGDRIGKTKRVRHECENMHSTAVSLSYNLFFDPRNISNACKLVTKRSRRTWARKLKRGDYPMLSTTHQLDIDHTHYECGQLAESKRPTSEHQGSVIGC